MKKTLNRYANILIVNLILAIAIIFVANYFLLSRVDASSYLPIHPYNPKVLSFNILATLASPIYILQLTEQSSILEVENLGDFRLEDLKDIDAIQFVQTTELPEVAKIDYEALVNKLITGSRISIMSYSVNSVGINRIESIIFE